jgi:hypothetical protein
MARALLVDRGMPKSLWFFALRHAVQVCNYLPVMLEGKITTAFEQVHKSQPNFQAILYPIFSHGYFRCTRDSNRERLQFEPQTQPGIAIGRSELANGLMFWNPVTNRISVSADYRLDPLGHLPSPFNIKFDGPLECSPLASKSDITEPFPLGTSVFVQHKNASTRATFLSVPLDSSDTAKEHHYYTVNLVTGSNLQLPRDSSSADPYTEAKSSLKHDDTDNGIMSLPNWFRHNQKIMLEIDGTYARGNLQLKLNGIWEFVTLNKHGQVHISHPLPNLAFDWTDRVESQTLILGWQDISHFLGTADHVSAALCQRPCPPSLIQALNPQHPDHAIWLASYKEEYDGLK